MKHPGPDHPISIAPADGVVIVSVNGIELARSEMALALSEASYQTVYYIPREDIEMSCLIQGDRRTHCPYKGDATHFDVATGDERLENAAWSYETPFETMAAIAGHVAFYRDRVDISVAER